MLDKTGYAALGDIYDAAINPGRWRRALDGVVGAIDARAIALMIRQAGPDWRDRQMLSSVYLDFMRKPQGMYYGLRYSRLQDSDWDYLSLQKAHSLVHDTDMGVTADALDKRPDYAFLRRKLSVRRRCGVRLNGDRVWFDAISVAFDAAQPAPPPAALSRLSSFLPHLTKAVEMGRTFSQLKSNYAAVLKTLDRVKVGLAIAVPGGAIPVQNVEAERIFALGDGLDKAPDGTLRCADAQKSAALAQSIQQACDTARGRDGAPETLLTMMRPSGATPFLVDVAPLRDSKTDIAGVSEGALITIVDPDRVPYLRMDRFEALYELTPAEAAVCKLLIQGVEPQVIAEMRNTTPVTIKNQIAAILAKTGVSRRLELIRLVIRVLPPDE